MTRRNAVALAALVLAAIGYAAYRWQDGAEDRMRAEADAAAQARLAIVKPEMEKRRRRQVIEQENGRFLGLSGSRDGMTTPYPRPVSAWQSAERAWATQRLSGQRYATLLVPIQTTMAAFDRATRSYFFARLTQAVADAGGDTLPDPFLVQRAFGDGRRVLDRAEVFRMADIVGAKRVVWIFTGHDERGNMALHVQYQDRDADQRLDDGCPIVGAQLEDTTLGPGTTPIANFESQIPPILAKLGLTPAAAGTGATGSGATGTALPDSAASLDRFPDHPADAARVFQLLAELAPDFEDRARERYAEKSMLALRRSSPGDIGRPLLEARAWMLLGYRRAAIDALGKVPGGDAAFLKTLLDGDLVGARRQLARVSPGVEAAIARLELARMEASYRVERGVIGNAPSLGALTGSWVWFALIASTLPDSSLEPGSRTETRACLLEQVMQAAAPACAHDRLDSPELIATIRQWRATADAGRIRPGASPVPRREDLVDLIEAMQVDQDLGAGRFMQWSYGDGVDLMLPEISELEAVYRDHPRLLAWRAWVEYHVAKRAERASRDALVSAARRDAELALRFEHGQTRVAASALTAHIVVDQFAGEDPTFGSPYQDDLPFRPYFPELRGFSEPVWKAAWDNSTYDTMPLWDLGEVVGRIQGRWDRVEAELRIDPNRFAGSPLRDRLFGLARMNQGDEREAERLMRAAIRENKSDWQAHRELGLLLFRHGDADGAAQVYGSYAPPEARRGDLASAIPEAYLVGSEFYWAGLLQYARPYYRQAANESSDFGLAANARLHLADGEIEVARDLSERRAEEHGDPFAFRDYLAIRLALGDSEGVEHRFDQLAETAGPYVWDAMLVARRRDRADESAVAAWAGQTDRARAGEDVSFAARFLLKAGTMDRVPSAALAERVAALDLPIFRIQKLGRPASIARPQRHGSLQHVLGPSAAEDSVLPLGEFDQSEKTPVRSDLAEFAEAYRALLEQKTGLALERLASASKSFDLTQPSLGHMLVYYAYAAGLHGRESEVRKLLDAIRIDHRGYHDTLARGVLLALAGKDSEATALLRRALLRRDAIEAQPVSTMYLYAEICEWLHRATRRDVYRGLALDWARAVQSMQPWQAWPYAIEATLTNEPERRGLAIAMTYYLDPLSRRLAALPKAEVERALGTYGRRNPFIVKKSQRLQVQMIRPMRPVIPWVAEHPAGSTS